jgi:hypothetical protein
MHFDTESNWKCRDVMTDCPGAVVRFAELLRNSRLAREWLFAEIHSRLQCKSISFTFSNFNCPIVSVFHAFNYFTLWSRRVRLFGGVIHRNLLEQLVDFESTIMKFLLHPRSRLRVGDCFRVRKFFSLNSRLARHPLPTSVRSESRKVMPR